MRKIVCLGDSITYGYDSHTKMGNFQQVETPYPKHLNKLLGTNYTVINSGNTGWHAKTTLMHLDKLVFDHKPDTVILMLGINDARGSRKGPMRTKRNYMKNMQAIIDRITSHNIKLYILSPTPTFNKRVEKFNELALQLAKQNNIIALDMHKEIYHQLDVDGLTLNDILADKVHMSDDYYIKLAHIVYEKLPINR